MQTAGPSLVMVILELFNLHVILDIINARNLLIVVQMLAKINIVKLTKQAIKVAAYVMMVIFMILLLFLME
jgi:hypothetical protein